MQLAIGNIVEGKIAKITSYGAFVDFEDGGSGMIHISEIANTYVKDINDHVKLGDTVSVKVVGINEQNKISLSIKELQEKPAPAPRATAPRFSGRSSTPVSTGDPFEDMMNKYKKSSDDKLLDLKRVMDPRKGGSRRSHSK